MSGRLAAVICVGTELTSGFGLDTNSSEIALALTSAGYDVIETSSVPDDVDVIASAMGRLVSACDTVVVTGGLGPTHDDVTREAAARALGLALVRDDDLAAGLSAAAARHVEWAAIDQIYTQADVLEGARVLAAVTGTAPGQVAATARGELVLLPGPPREMHPMLEALSREWDPGRADPAVLRCSGISESDAQVRTLEVLGDCDGVGFTVLAEIGDVRVVLRDDGAGAERLAECAAAVAGALGDVCYSTDGSSLADAVLASARRGGITLATAESCTGGLVSAALTSPPGSSDAFLGGIVTYSNESKVHLLGVDPALIDAVGAVSDAVAMAMASGAQRHLAADVAVSVTGIAGPDGGTKEKPVGTVWFGIATPDGVRAEMRRFFGDRGAVRTRATATALDLLRRALPGA